MTVLTGVEFKAKYGTEFYKFLNDDLIHYYYVYHIGLNQDHIPFNPSGKCKSGGLNFTNEDNLINFHSIDSFIGVIEIPDESNVYIEEDYKFKADKFILSKIITDKKAILQVLKKSFEKKYVENNFDSKMLVDAIKAKEKAFIDYKKTHSPLDLKIYLKARGEYHVAYNVFVEYRMQSSPLLIKLALNFINDVKTKF